MLDTQDLLQIATVGPRAGTLPVVCKGPICKENKTTCIDI